MEQQWENQQEDRFPGEVVEVYRQPEYREVVETYCAPLPAGMKRQHRPEIKIKQRRQSKTGLWIFLGCLMVAVILAVFAYVFGDRETEQPSPNFRFEFHVGDQELGTSSNETNIAAITR